MARRRKSSADRPAGGIGVHQGRIVLLEGVEQVAGAGLDDPCHSVSIEGRPHRIDLATENRRILVGVECTGVEGDRDTLDNLARPEG